MKAFTINTNGQIKQVAPSNGRDFNLDELRDFVGGWIQIINLRDGYLMVVNEEGKRVGLSVNAEASKIYGNPYDFIVGNVLVCQKDQIV